MDRPTILQVFNIVLKKGFCGFSQGSGCVSAESEGEAFASAYLQAIVDVIAEIKFEGEDEDEAFARAYGELMAGATAKVTLVNY